MLPPFLRFCKSLPRHLLATARHLWSYVNRGQYSKGEAAFVWPSPATLAVELGLSKASLYRHLAELERGGWLRRAVRQMGDWMRRGWELLNPMQVSPCRNCGAETRRYPCESCGWRPSADGDPDPTPVSGPADETILSHRQDSPPLYEPPLNQHPIAHARETSSDRTGVGGGSVRPEPPRSSDGDRARTTTEAQARSACVDRAEDSAGPGRTPAVCTADASTQALPRPESTTRSSPPKGQPRNADQARAADLWMRYEARRIAEGCGALKRHRGHPMYRDLVHMVELVDHAQATRPACDGDREAAWQAVSRYTEVVWSLIDHEQHPGKRDHLRYLRSDGYEWSPTRFDRVMRDDDCDVTGERAQAREDERESARQEERRREEAEQVPMSDEVFNAFLAEMLALGEPARGHAPST